MVLPLHFASLIACILISVGPEAQYHVLGWFCLHARTANSSFPLALCLSYG